MNGNPFSDAFLDELNEIGDPPLDELIRQIGEQPGGLGRVRQLFFVVHNVERLTGYELRVMQQKELASPELVEFFESRDTVPQHDWIDPDLLQQGGQFYRDYGILGFMVLAFASLPSCYCWSREAWVLTSTARLEDNVPRRVPETAQLILNVVTRGAFDKAGIGIHSAHRVRLMHAIIRYLLMAEDTSSHIPDDRRPIHRHWDRNWGVPISQEYLALTLLTFHYVVIEGLLQLGVRFDESCQKAYLHLWNVVGCLLGLDERILRNLASLADAETLFVAGMRRHRQATPEGAALQAALLSYLRNNVIRRAPGGSFHPLAHLPVILTRRLAGRDTARLLGVRRNFAEGLLDVPMWYLLRWVVYLESRTLLRGAMDAVIRYAVRHIWDLHYKGRPLTLPHEDTGSERHRAVTLPPSLAEDWQFVDRH